MAFVFTQRRVALRFRSTTFRKRGRVATAEVAFSNKSAPVLCKRNAVLLLLCAVFRPIRSSVNVVLDYVYTTPERNNAGRIYERLHYTVVVF